MWRMPLLSSKQGCWERGQEGGEIAIGCDGCCSSTWDQTECVALCHCRVWGGLGIVPKGHAPHLKRRQSLPWGTYRLQRFSQVLGLGVAGSAEARSYQLRCWVQGWWGVFLPVFFPSAIPPLPKRTEPIVRVSLKAWPIMCVRSWSRWWKKWTDYCCSMAVGLAVLLVQDGFRSSGGFRSSAEFKRCFGIGFKRCFGIGFWEGTAQWFWHCHFSTALISSTIQQLTSVAFTHSKQSARI